MKKDLGLTINELKVGDSSTFTKKVTEKMVNDFAEISGDHNPVHLDEKFAKTTMFKSRIAHGALVSSLFSNIFGNTLPGRGCIYFRQDSKFIAPVYLGDTITAKVIVKEIIPDRNRVIFDTIATNQNGKDVIVGSAVILPRKDK